MCDASVAVAVEFVFISVGSLRFVLSVFVHSHCVLCFCLPEKSSPYSYLQFNVFIKCWVYYLFLC